MPSVRTRDLHAARVARRRNGSAVAADDEEPHPAPTHVTPAVDGRELPREPVRSPGSPADGAALVNGNGGGIAAEELARRVAARNLYGVPADELEAWLQDAGLAEATPAGLLVPTPRGRELAASLDSGGIA